MVGASSGGGAEHRGRGGHRIDRPEGALLEAGGSPVKSAPCDSIMRTFQMPRRAG